MIRPDTTDEELMILYQSGSEEAFTVLYKRHLGKIFGYIKSRVRSDQMSQDLLQEVFIKLHKSKHLYKPSLPALPWIFTIANSVTIDGLRKEGRKKEALGQDLDQYSNQVEDNQNAIKSLEPLLENLTENQKTVLKMRYVDEKTFENISERLNTSEDNVRKIVSRTIQQLKQKLKGDRL